MADITISDLELAPALTDDMVLPVENTTDTYAATLAMLRRLINKAFVEVENADFNALTDDGFYQCTGTPTNSPVAGAINWTLQVSAENGVVVQRAFSLDDNFANLYIRRWIGVTWTGWLEVGAGALDNKANISLSNIDETGQAKFDAKANVDLNNLSTAGQAIINGKADINLSNLNNTGNAAASNLNSKGIRTVVETYKNGSEWYRIWSDSWIEQGGATSTPAAQQAVRITFLKPFTVQDSYFVGMLPFVGNNLVNSLPTPAVQVRQKTYMDCSVGSYDSRLGAIAFCWYACGY